MFFYYAGFWLQKPTKEWAGWKVWRSTDRTLLASCLSLEAAEAAIRLFQL